MVKLLVAVRLLKERRLLLLRRGHSRLLRARGLGRRFTLALGLRSLALLGLRGAQPVERRRRLLGHARGALAGLEALKRFKGRRLRRGGVSPIRPL